MTLPMPTHCPVTGEALEVTKLSCPESGITIEGRFQPNEFALLPEDQLEFMRIFIKVRGNLKEVERVMGLSYPTIRQRFDTLLKTLGYELDTPRSERAEILSQLEAGDISAQEATERLRALKGNG